MEDTLRLTSPAFEADGRIPLRHTGFGEDLSPELILEGLDPHAACLALTLDDLDIPLTAAYCHWALWNLPPLTRIPQGVAPGEHVTALGGATQGVGFGKHRYAGPKQPFFVRNRHRYRFTVFALDAPLDLPASAGKKELLRAMEGHVLQTATLTGTHRRGDR